MDLLAGGLAGEVDHPSPRPRLGQVDRLLADRDDGRRRARRAAAVTINASVSAITSSYVGERLVGLHHRELGVVPGGQALVAEHPPDLEDPVHAADDQPLEVQLEGDAQEQLHVERVVVGRERAGVGTAGLDVQDRCLDLDEAALVERPPEAGDDGVADVEGPAGLGVDDEVGVALAESGVGVAEAVPLVGQRPYRLGQQVEPIDLDRQLALAGRHDRAVHADPVATVERLHLGEGVVADDGLRHEQLHLDAAVDDRREHELAAVALEEDPAGDGRHGRRVSMPGSSSLHRCADLGHGVGAVEAVGVRLAAGRPQLLDLT